MQTSPACTIKIPDGCLRPSAGGNFTGDLLPKCQFEFVELVVFVIGAVAARIDRYVC